MNEGSGVSLQIRLAFCKTIESVDQAMDGGGMSWVIAVAIASSTKVDVEGEAC